MFGYDRDRGLIRVFIPPFLHKLFSELNRANETLLKQVQSHKIDDISLIYPPGIKPTRTNVIDKNTLNMVVGGVNYFPYYPKQKHVKQLDEILIDYSESEKYYSVPIDLIIELTAKFESDSKSDWSTATYGNCLNAMKQSKHSDGILIVRRNRDVKRATGTLLSPDDRKLGSGFNKDVVLTLYRLTGSVDKGWDGKPFWIPNIKFPDAMNFYKSG
jgi:hypothetical protein